MGPRDRLRADLRVGGRHCPAPCAVWFSAAHEVPVTIHYSLQNLGHAHPEGMAKPTKRKLSASEVTEEKVRVAEEMLRRAALAYAAVAELGPDARRWRRCWR